MSDDEILTWHRASGSGNDGDDSVEVAYLPDGGRALRDSKDPTGPVLRFTAGEWDAFTKGARAGEFD